ncbi:rRNA maturation RNase YbeY [Halomonas sp. MCCC 1A17488]|uniref:rRNA maturation RNase YbeY n=1 Tax=unclassified Halomonas TaxID=2609666 RepID=UPI0018D24419|nr:MULTISPECIES: rRNA maturation RNase YbeY [unclassified Halomonas]MCE8018277.1 rRNA maturation RNase YbeY [Halomonas sp. MCCC 1A17488]MCG3241610.1 rRNA maturation RNase YbeY [Halomonas sp. MCCC 1A17488]QPP48443.1 rRNA maturation RNase YbeY [Halomonas sp. SS10-MC5]
MSAPPIVDLQLAISSEELPAQAELEAWTRAVLARFPRETRHEVTVRIVDAEEGQALNRDYRGRDKPTNVLSFPFEGPPGVSLPLLGDLVLCHPVVLKEAHEQAKRLVDHYAHLVIHGMLHLLGHDHLEENEAEVMEGLEREILADFAIADPYAPLPGSDEQQDMDERDANR